MNQYTSFNPFQKIKNNYQLAKMKTLSDALAYINDNLIKETQVDSYGNHEQNHTFIVFSDFSNKIKELPIDDSINSMPIFLPLSLIFLIKTIIYPLIIIFQDLILFIIWVRHLLLNVLSHSSNIMMI